LFVNPGPPGRHWLEVRLVGVRSNRSAIGAHVRCDVVEQGRRRSIHRVVGSGSSFGGNSLRQHFGLGSARRCETLEVSWPTSRLRQIWHDVAADRAIEIREDDARIVSRPRQRRITSRACSVPCCTSGRS